MELEAVIITTSLAAIAVTAIVFLTRSYRLSERLSEARQQADTDTLTGLLNRGALNNALRDAFSAPGALQLVYIDLANFKDVNDTAGHEAGDAVLEKVADTLRRHAPSTASISRMGGDEFCVLLPDHTDLEALEFCERVCTSLKTRSDLPDGVESVDLSAGVASRSEDCQSAEELLRRGDRAMYHSKSCRLGPELYSANLDESLRVRREIRSELGTAFNAGRLQLAYQPLVNARTGELAGAEALLRWPDKIGRAGSPGEFIPIAEETGLIVDIGKWVIQEALAQIARMDNKIAIAVNVSTRQFLDTDFSTLVADSIIEAGVPPNLLKIEITESVLITYTEKAAHILRELRDIGVQILLDDFGTGYSSLSYIQKFDFDMLKIDRAFVRAMDKSRAGGDLLRSIINMGHSLDMEVVAEGVETRRQAAMLQLLGVDYLQGFALGAPGTADKLLNFQPSETLTKSSNDIQIQTEDSKIKPSSVA